MSVSKSIEVRVEDEREQTIGDWLYMQTDDGSWLGPDDEVELDLDQVLDRIAAHVRGSKTR